MKKILFCGIALLVLVLFGLAFEGRNTSRGVNELLHGSTTTAITKVEITGYLTGVPVQINITNQADLAYLSDGFRQAVQDSSRSGRFFQGRVWTKGHGSSRLYFLIPTELDCLIILQPTLLDIKDPASFRIPLQKPVPNQLAIALQRLAGPAH